MKPDEAAALMRELFGGAYDPPIDAATVDAVMRQRNILVFEKRIDGCAVSMVTFYSIRLFSRHLGVIEEVTTLPEHRNRGYATALVKEAVEYARSIGVNCIELTCREDRLEVIRFYEGLGFRDRNNRAMRLCFPAAAR